MFGWFSLDAWILRVLAGALILASFIQLRGAEAGATPAARDDEVSDPYLTRLLDEINLRRQAAGTPRLRFVPRRANDALVDFLREMAPDLGWPGPCGHHLVDGGSSWDYMQAKAGSGARRTAK